MKFKLSMAASLVLVAQVMLWAGPETPPAPIPNTTGRVTDAAPKVDPTEVAASPTASPDEVKSDDEKAAEATPIPSFKPVAPHKKVRMAIYEGPGATGGKTHHEMEKKAFGSDSNVDVTILTPEDIQNGKLSEFDVLLQPGGSGSAQAKALGEKGRGQIKDFVRAGGGYIGICAGAYLASAHYDWSLAIINTQVVDRAHWARGRGKVTIALNDDGKKLFEASASQVPINYGQGPLMAPKHDPSLPEYTELATFSSEIAKNGAPTGVMKGTTAIATSTYGKGRVICISPHAEGIPEEYSLLNHALLWVAEPLIKAETAAK
ncbi:MAG TPA: BPL-N domain-containing protein [Capsulimonadaceae bacterium]|jgi:phosphoribosylformylglycinamidine (FGAM) synthase-like amidotransferase family enzyme